jgi:hypothetical protein
MTITDDMLSAYLDGELSPADAAMVKAAVEADPALAQRLKSLKAATRRFTAVVRGIDAEPMPASVEALLNAKTDNVVQFRRPKRETPKWAVPAAMAASLVAIVVATGNLGRMPGLDAGDLIVAAGPVDPHSDLHRALEKTPSATDFAVRGGSVRPVATFRVADGALCREFVALSDAHAARAVACRGDRQWTVKIAAEEAAAGGGYQPASGPASAINAFVNSAIAGDALGPDEESALIKGGWRSK